MTKKCHACDGEVPEDHKGKCPLCDKEEGYAYLVNIRESVKIEKKIMKKALKDVYDQFDKLEKQYKNNPTILKRIENKRDQLIQQEVDLMKKAETYGKEDFEKSQEPSIQTKKFSVNAIIGTPEHRISELEKELRAKGSIGEAILRIDSKVSDIIVRLSKKQTIGLGVLASLTASIIFGLWMWIFS